MSRAIRPESAVAVVSEPAMLGSDKYGKTSFVARGIVHKETRVGDDFVVLHVKFLCLFENVPNKISVFDVGGLESPEAVNLHKLLDRPEYLPFYFFPRMSKVIVEGISHSLEPVLEKPL